MEHSGITPDVMVLSKAIGGSLPLAVVVYRDELDAWQPGAHAGTFRGNQLAMAAGAATLAYVRENRLAERAAELGARMLRQLQQLAGEFACIGDARGKGLMIGVEVVEPEAESVRDEGRRAGLTARETAGSEPGVLAAPDGLGGAPGQAEPGTAVDLGWPRGSGARGLMSLDPARIAGGSLEGMARAGGGARAAAAQDLDRHPRPAAPELAAAIQRECLRRGLIVELGGRRSSVVRLLPPLTISDEQADAVLERLADAVDAVSRGTTGHTARTIHTSQTRRDRVHQRHPGHRGHDDLTDRAHTADRSETADKTG